MYFAIAIQERNTCHSTVRITNAVDFYTNQNV